MADRTRTFDAFSDAGGGRAGGTDPLDASAAPPATDDLDVIEAFLAQVPLFAELPPRARRELAGAARWLHLPGGGYLFRQGDVPDALAVVWAGRLQVIDEHREDLGGDGADEVIGLLGRGSWVGELSLLTDAPRSAAIRAVRDSELLEVPASAFARVLEREPELGITIARMLATQLQSGARTPVTPTEPDTIAVLPLGDGLPLERLVERLERVVRDFGTVAVLTAPPDGSDGPRWHGERADTASRLRAWSDHLDRLEADCRVVVLVAPDPDTDPTWASFCVRSADRILALVRGGTPPAWARALLAPVPCDVVFVGSRLQSARITPTLEALRPDTHHHLPEGVAFDEAADRISRRACGRALGLVLSGGGARGFAHIGVLDQLAASGVAIDRIGGCSAGALAAALHAMGRTPDQMAAICREEFVEHHPFTDFGVPRDGLIKGKRAMATLTRIFGDARIEELSLSLFAVSADLATGDLVVHRAGLVRNAVAASMAIPGLAPPVHDDGHLLVDGGLLDNFPVDVMQAGLEGPVIGVDVMRSFPVPDATPGPGGRRLKELAGPGIVSTLARSIVLGGWRRAEENRRAADLLISPAVDHIGMFEFDRIDEAIDAGRRAAVEALARGLPR